MQSKGQSQLSSNPSLASTSYKAVFQHLLPTCPRSAWKSFCRATWMPCAAIGTSGRGGSTFLSPLWANSPRCCFVQQVLYLLDHLVPREDLDRSLLQRMLRVVKVASPKSEVPRHRLDEPAGGSQPAAVSKPCGGEITVSRGPGDYRTSRSCR